MTKKIFSTFSNLFDTRVLLLATAFALCGIGTTAIAQELEIRQAYATPTRPDQPNAAAFVEIHNRGKTADRLVALSVSGDIAERAELHTMKHDKGVMMMREVTGFDIAAGGRLTLAPGGDHLMLIGIKRPLKEGEEFPAVLTFQNAKEVKVTLKVRETSKEHRHRQGHDHGK